jgi:CubicO group peptidase (beta-lactamase class C family)
VSFQPSSACRSSRFSRSELRRYVLAAGIVAEISGVTIWRWLHEDALRPWNRRSWIFPRDPDFAIKAGRVLDLYHRRWKGRALAEDEFGLSADEKTQIPIRTRCHPLTPPAPGRPIRVEHEYRRHGVCAYLAAWDVHRARLFGKVVKKISIVAFDAFVAHVMAQESYRSARRVFWIVDGGTILRGQAAVDRLEAASPTSPSSICPSTPAGSIRSRSTSRSFSAKPSRPPTSPRAKPSRLVSSASKTTTS